MLLEKVSEDHIKAMKARDSLRISVLSMLKSAIKYQEIENKEKGKCLTDDDVVNVINKEVKKREESIEMYREAGRDELASKEAEELAILKEYLPEQLSEQEVEKYVNDIIAKLNATSQKDFGRVMKSAVAELKGKADPTAIRKAVEKRLVE
jgi:uncharacterized protein YqeY